MTFFDVTVTSLWRHRSIKYGQGVALDNIMWCLLTAVWIFTIRLLVREIHQAVLWFVNIDPSYDVKARLHYAFFPSVFCVLSVFAAYRFPKWSSADCSSWGELHWRRETEITHEPDSQDVPVPIKSSKFWTFLRDLRVTGMRDMNDALWQTAKMSLFR